MSDRWLQQEALARAIHSMGSDVMTVEQYAARLGRDDIADLIIVGMKIFDLVNLHRSREAA